MTLHVQAFGESWTGSFIELREGNPDLGPFLLQRIQTLNIGASICPFGIFTVTRIK